MAQGFDFATGDNSTPQEQNGGDDKFFIAPPSTVLPPQTPMGVQNTQSRSVRPRRLVRRKPRVSTSAVSTPPVPVIPQASPISTPPLSTPQLHSASSTHGSIPQTPIVDNTAIQAQQGQKVEYTKDGMAIQTVPYEYPFYNGTGYPKGLYIIDKATGRKVYHGAVGYRDMAIHEEPHNPQTRIVGYKRYIAVGIAYEDLPQYKQKDLDENPYDEAGFIRIIKIFKGEPYEIQSLEARELQRKKLDNQAFKLLNESTGGMSSYKDRPVLYEGEEIKGMDTSDVKALARAIKSGR